MLKRRCLGHLSDDELFGESFLNPIFFLLMISQRSLAEFVLAYNAA